MRAVLDMAMALVVRVIVVVEVAHMVVAIVVLLEVPVVEDHMVATWHPVDVVHQATVVVNLDRI
jgi:hypothetical protein